MSQARYLLDTNICIYLRSRRPPSVYHRFGMLEPGEAVMSAITFGELRFGVIKGRQPERDAALLAEMIKIVPVSPLSAATAEHYAEIRLELSQRGELIGPNDLWIAAHARSAGLTLVTNNVREFGRVPGLTVENWTAATP